MGIRTGRPAGRPYTGPPVALDEKWCAKCKIIKPHSEFHSSSSTKDGLRAYCKTCSKQWTVDNRQKVRENHKKSQVKFYYKLTWDDFIAKLEAQDHRCAICRAAIQFGVDLHVDHDHDCCPSLPTCGKCLRGFLCKRCNFMLGNARDNTAILRTAADYIEVSRMNGTNPAITVSIKTTDVVL